MRYLFAGGGTGGHIYPAVAIAKEILKNEQDAQILFVGTEKGLEKELVPREGFELVTIEVQGFKRKLSFDTLKTVYKAFTGFKQANKILKDFKPHVVIGTGGYVCGPVLMAAVIKRIPTLIHEQNAFPGLTNRLLSPFVDIVAVSFEDSVKYFKKAKKVVVTGNPIREELLRVKKEEGREKLGFSMSKPLVVSVGGSRGAEKINSTMVELLKIKDRKFQVLIITGSSNYDKVLEKVKKENVVLDDSVKIVPYSHEMQYVYAAADIMICRAGAITLSEITAVGVPSILIPSPYVANNHQEYNARLLERQGASHVILEKDLDAKKLYEKIEYLLSEPSLLNEMREKAKSMSRTDASYKIYQLVKTIT
ncbi:MULTISPECIES: undecaprenyldiphospho-muramoylpentapeptide beta-N-acetylglucosaminyltransferase [Caldanaerobacter]|uniref:UDP-N-acetylglucosamine--N-acetylmuramyl-(pentapeptide) pyrophosphoryl-undecaprenol N-acetylglucosamine transferase n=2 Tax=Caldanaerobacter subterraneus TaxID=911092 RepID=U5CXS5_CALSX|nr:MULTISPECIES: undecaprenyldiphospho-muramoylpentapeptide beta-N-acetylglucosaminyltransferase [Caldanaerobacter]ERM92807.1 UDP-diphospho-muramoylpentapeptide beta-N- acetylglucosaminyltransferase [Caldanaerobacter subterraneus subsp. yonseiensis KB-1]MDI3518689.1 UDP-N-acetylglucosamine--N-acetylmuramyl-(pentapeptide) pyrophosphoryl-undecaprenol [Caldanaerobacter sp.]TCO66932.1 UDP-N-acetylglucosamine-N-acetylmuramylpentapeptide N-acetylglucosamine transferase [Caldanaerobacter subterraneus]